MFETRHSRNGHADEQQLKLLAALKSVLNIVVYSNSPLKTH